MEAYLLDWANLLLRWLHVIVAIAWIGSSFYFVWLDNHLTAPLDPQLKDKGVGGELWAVHGGGFYNPQKYLGAPPRLPKQLHWFYWESYSTWLSGFSLFLLVYIFNARSYLIDPAVAQLSPALAIIAAFAFLIVGWLVYDALCRLLSKKEQLLSILIVALVVLAAWSACHLFSGRAAFLIVGAMMASIMSANVFFWIIPGQRKVVAAMRAGDTVDPVHGQRGKQRSVHNTYFTLPVLFAMLSNHYSMTYSTQHNWLVLVVIMLAGVLVRQYFILRHKGKNQLAYPLIAIALLAAIAAWIAPRPASAPAAATTENGVTAVTLAQVQGVIQARCVQCHSHHPTMMDSPAKGLLLETPEQIQAKAQLIVQQVVQQKLMPLGNLTQITEQERTLIARWAQQRPATQP
ncbi:urate hydroxylase PuuD [Undibacterium oligocarboniphilum]|uniref:Urate hydroxylase PuuD n=1 Tax=Undibacterium oligocarboniphilum TaxID=666702 RepID=A0A850QFB6_9BURK|nr:urate hydroxylase PuuD [Undibacterium oligocarboniphilum]MBC3869500.1 urate hydroxylase PuuD [Undibacterium oligocarboniphilum]NVO77879.1 urate hydroxylase PuuD [Undibacterium oligocarboniphilum]